jgi:hypothetical protein
MHVPTGPLRPRTRPHLEAPAVPWGLPAPAPAAARRPRPRARTCAAPAAPPPGLLNGRLTELAASPGQRVGAGGRPPKEFSLPINRAALLAPRRPGPPPLRRAAGAPQRAGARATDRGRRGAGEPRVPPGARSAAVPATGLGRLPARGAAPALRRLFTTPPFPARRINLQGDPAYLCYPPFLPSVTRCPVEITVAPNNEPAGAAAGVHGAGRVGTD